MPNFDSEAKKKTGKKLILNAHQELHQLPSKLTLSLLGKPGYAGGGGKLTPPPLNPMFDVQIRQMIHH